MKLVNINQGLGNQMFQYAFMLALQKHCPNEKVFPNYYLRLQPGGSEAHEKHTLTDAFELRRPNILLSMLLRVMRRTIPKIDMPDLVYHPDIWQQVCGTSAFVVGFWQSEKYFDDIREQLRHAFVFKGTQSQYCQSVVADIRNSRSVAVHVRRGDYCLKPGYIDIHHAGYYTAAFSHVEQQVPDARYFVFSDDIGWCKQHFNGDRFVFVEGHGGESTHLDMYLMSQCEHNIIANSTFSWWGAWLNRNPEKLVLTPDQWFSPGAVVHNMDDILPADWIRIALPAGRMEQV